MPSTISLITPVYNDPRVGVALDSIAQQTYAANIESIIMDGGSSSETFEAIEPFEGFISKVVSESDDGIYDAMNKGIAIASGDIVGILNADDRYSSQSVIEEIVSAFEDPSVMLSYGNIRYVNEDGEFTRFWRAGESSRMKWRLGWMPPHPSFFVRREVYERLGMFCMDFPIAADYELMLRYIYKYELKYRYIDKTIVDMATGGNSSHYVGSFFSVNSEVVRAWRSNHLGGWQLVPVFKQVRKSSQWLHRSPLD